MLTESKTILYLKYSKIQSINSVSVHKHRRLLVLVGLTTMLMTACLNPQHDEQKSSLSNLLASSEEPTFAQSAAASSPISGLDFPSNGETSDDIRFRFTGSNLQPMYPATYMWKVKLRRHSGYYTTFFWGPDGAFTGTSYYGAHPYPDGEPKPSSRSHKWELSLDGRDVVNDVYGHSTQLGYDVWHTQALRVYDNGSNKVHEFFWNLPDTTKVIRYYLSRSYGNSIPSNPALNFGDAPWNKGNERLSGILRGIQLYKVSLSSRDIITESQNPLTSNAGASGIWYLNLNPIPNDITDKSGKAHHPNWVSSSRAKLWSGETPPDTNPIPPPPPAPNPPTLTFTANPNSIAYGGNSILSWNSSYSNSCTASGAWSGSKAISGQYQTSALSTSQTFSLSCVGPGGQINKSVTVTVNPVSPTPTPVPAPSSASGLDFPSNGQTSADIRLLFKGSALPPMYPVTYLWQYKPRQQSGYYSIFFWGPGGNFTGTNYYGVNPYPMGDSKNSSRSHQWEITIDGNNVITDNNSHSTIVDYDRWYIQMLRVYDNGSQKIHEFYWDLPDTTKVIRVSKSQSYGASLPSDPTLGFGDAPWSIGSERLSGILRGIQIYTSAMSLSDIQQEYYQPKSTTLGNLTIWYLNRDPSPSDVSDKSGKNHHPQWSSSSRPALWTETP